MPKNNMLETKFNGDVDAYRSYMREIASRGGTNVAKEHRPFYKDHELAKIAASKGGRISRKKKISS